MRANYSDQGSVLRIFIATSLAVVFAFILIDNDIWSPQNQAIAANGGCNNGNGGCNNNNNNANALSFDVPSVSVRDFHEE